MNECMFMYMHTCTSKICITHSAVPFVPRRRRHCLRTVVICQHLFLQLLHLFVAHFFLGRTYNRSAVFTDTCYTLASFGHCRCCHIFFTDHFFGIRLRTFRSLKIMEQCRIETLLQFLLHACNIPLIIRHTQQHANKQTRNTPAVVCNMGVDRLLFVCD